MRKRLALALAVSFAGAGCSGTTAVPSFDVAPSFTQGGEAATHIKHVVIVVQENRTFDNLFYGFPNSEFARYGRTHDGKRVKLHPIDLSGPCLTNEWAEAVADYDGGRMDGFDLNQFACTRHDAAGDYVYSYVNRSEIQPYWTMAERYVLADHMFPTMFGNSFTAHLDLIAGTASLSPSISEVDTPLAQPWGCDAPAGTTTSILNSSRQESVGGGPFPCFTQFRTLADTLDAARVSWKYYAPAVAVFGGNIWSEFSAIKSVRYGPDWSRNVSSPQTRAIYDARDGHLPSVSWVIPDAADSDHPGFGHTGPSWVAAVVNAIGRSRYWKNTAIVVLWDDWGGWYDDLPPPHRDYRGLGIRVPCIVISPYAKAGYVAHTQYEFGSVVKLVEEIFGLPALGSTASGYTDQRANSMLDVFDFHQKPRAFVPISATKPASYFLARPPSNRAPDDD